MVTIRAAEAQDIDSLVSLLHVLFSIEEDFVYNEDRQRQGLAMMLENPKGCVLVAEADGRIIGMCTGQIVVSTAEGGPALLVEDVVVAEAWRGRGVGRRLLKRLTVWTAARGISRLQLLTDRNNTAALGFYEKLGWQPTALICLRKRLG